MTSEWTAILLFVLLVLSSLSITFFIILRMVKAGRNSCEAICEEKRLIGKHHSSLSPQIPEIRITFPDGKNQNCNMVC